MGEYVDVFTAQGFDKMEDLEFITNEILKDVGVNKIAHRLKILRDLHLFQEEKHREELEQKMLREEYVFDQEDLILFHPDECENKMDYYCKYVHRILNNYPNLDYVCGAFGLPQMLAALIKRLNE